MEGQQIQRDFGGSVWESNPPPDPRRAGSPALKAGKVTGPFSPPHLRNHLILRPLMDVFNFADCCVFMGWCYCGVGYDAGNCFM
jgi:hypothetical protein